MPITVQGWRRPNTPVTPAGITGWQLTRAAVGLTGAGVDRAALPAYAGGHKPPRGAHLYRHRFDSWLDLSNGNITLEQCLFQPAPGNVNAGDFQLTTWGSGGMNGPVSIIDCEYDGSLLSAHDQAWIGFFVGGANIIRCYIHHSGSGFNTYSSFEATGADLLLENNWVDTLIAYGDPNGSGNHQSAYTTRDLDTSTNPNRRLIVRGNHLAGDGTNMSGTVLLQPNSGNIANLTLVDNLLIGDNGYQLYIDIDTGRFPGVTYANTSIANNRIASSPANAVYVRPGVPAFTQWSDNYLYDSAASDGKGAVLTQPQGV